VLEGRLAVPTTHRVPLPGSVQFVFREGDPRTELPAVASWLGEQFAELPTLPRGRIVRKSGGGPSKSKRTAASARKAGAVRTG
jgi:hypothetical protein